MERSRLWTSVVVCAVLLSVASAAEINDSDQELEVDTRALMDFYPKSPNLTNEKQLVSFLLP